MFFLSFISIPSSGMTGLNDKLEAVVKCTSICPPYVSMHAVHICYSITDFAIEVVMVVLMKIQSVPGF